MPIRAHAKTIVALLHEHNETVAVAESITAGGLGAAITHAPGASDVFLGGVIAYTNDVKTKFLGVDPALIEEFSVISEEVANAMAEGAREKFGTTWGIATTGIAGPGDYQAIPEGTVWVAIRGPINQSIQLQLDGGRDGIRTGAISSAIGTFARILSYQKK
jgi:nicotinamide-nucleotide amidase